MEMNTYSTFEKDTLNYWLSQKVCLQEDPHNQDYSKNSKDYMGDARGMQKATAEDWPGSNADRNPDVDEDNMTHA
jgi:hypothetical protein